MKNNTDSEISFYIDKDGEILRFDKDGSFYVKGKKVTEDIEVYRAMDAWLNQDKMVTIYKCAIKASQRAKELGLSYDEFDDLEKAIKDFNERFCDEKKEIL